ncbi:MAG: sensor histidine kinase, partial [Syntrophothermus sp.]
AGEALEMSAGPEILASSDITIHPGMPVVFGDRLRIREVYQNLIENAIKYRENNRKLILTIGCLEKESEPVFFVKDNGIGIQKPYFEKIFGLFEKLDARSNGSGIGLAIVKRIIELHCGRIWVESESGTGSVFYFTIQTKE